MTIRTATSSDIAAMVNLSASKRKDYEKAQPIFWKMADNADTSQANWFHKLLSSPECILLVAEDNLDINGFIIGKLMNAPEVYNPGGLTLMIDDFCVSSADLWETVGTELVNHIIEIAKTKDAAQILVVCGQHDEAKRVFLKKKNLNVASEWYTKII
jgi:hypothetical protein